MEEVTKDLPEAAFQTKGEARIRIAVVGRPNAGKSSLINRVLGSERLLVSELPGTTRDAVDTPFALGGREYLLIDTAGIRRKGRVREKLDRFSMIKALRSLDRCHVAVVLLDAAAGIAEQDARICGYALERGRALLLGINKWDLVKRDSEAKRRLTDQIERQLQFVSFAPRIDLSARTGERVLKLFDKVDVLYEQFCRRIGTGSLNRWLQDQVARKPPPRPGRGSLKLFYVTQTSTAPPTFVLFANRPEAVHFSYHRFLVNRIRENFGLTLTPIRLILRKKQGIRSTSGS
jgi:GTP-binding protein